MHDHKKDILYFLLLMGGLFFLWVYTGGPERSKQNGDAYNKFQEPLAPLDSGRTYDEKITLPKSPFSDNGGSY